MRPEPEAAACARQLYYLCHKIAPVANRQFSGVHLKSGKRVEKPLSPAGPYCPSRKSNDIPATGRIAGQAPQHLYAHLILHEP